MANANESSNRIAFQEEKEERSAAGISLYNNFPSKNIQYFQCDNYTEYNYPRCYEIPDILQVTGLGIVRLHELHDYEHTNQTEDKEDSKVNPLSKEREDRNYCKPQREGDNGDLLFSHQDSC